MEKSGKKRQKAEKSGKNGHPVSWVIELEILLIY
jgi:hypothetical protein